MSQQHTPGPLHPHYDDGSGEYRVLKHDGSCVAVLGDNKADADLFAASPELLELLEWALAAGQLGRLSQARDYVERAAAARAAIKKARGLD